MDLSERSKEIELMDGFQGTENELELVLTDINRVNAMLGGNTITLDAVFRLLRKYPKKSYMILDVGCADGNMLREIALRARKAKIIIKLIGLDLNDLSLVIAKRKSLKFPEIEYLNQDVFTLENMDLDIVITTLTLHHFRDRDIPKFLHRFSEMASIGVVINDLQRSRLAYYLFRAFSVIFIKTYTAKHDGLISILRGFKKKELQKFADQLPNIDHQISWKWAFRFRWVLQK